MLSLRYKSRRAETRGRPLPSVRTLGHFSERRQQSVEPLPNHTCGAELSGASQGVTCASAQKQREQQRQQQKQQRAAEEPTCTPSAAFKSTRLIKEDGAHDASTDSGASISTKKKIRKQKQQKHPSGEKKGEDERGLKRMRLDYETKRHSSQQVAQGIRSQLMENGGNLANCKQQERQLQLVKQFSDRGLAAGFSSDVVDRLQGGRFRSLNEFLYTKRGNEAFAKYQKEPQLFDIYHAGYRAQVRRWPLNPLDCVAAWLSKRPKEWIVGDFGCGEAALALRFPERTFHSFDLVAANERITACDISSVPLPDASLDVAVFCLSLMGQDWPAFLREARRVLRRSGYLIVAEVSSRISSLSEFVAAVESLGFRNTKQKDLASFFVLLVFKVENQPVAKLKELSSRLLQPCLYKRR